MHTTASVSLTSSLKPRTKKALVYQLIIQMLMQPSLLFIPDTFIIITSAGAVASFMHAIKGTLYYLINVRLVD